MIGVGLTPRQRELLDYLRFFIGEHGYAPSFDEMGRALGYTKGSYKGSIHKLITGLEERGYIRRRPYQARSIEIVPQAINIHGDLYRFIPKQRAA